MTVSQAEFVDLLRQDNTDALDQIYHKWNWHNDYDLDAVATKVKDINNSSTNLFMYLKDARPDVCLSVSFCEYLERSAEQSNMRALAELALQRIYLVEDISDLQMFKTEINNLYKAIDSGNSFARVYLGVILGRLDSSRDVVFEEYLTKYSFPDVLPQMHLAAIQGNQLAELYLGQIYTEGILTKRNLKLGFECLLNAFHNHMYKIPEWGRKIYVNHFTVLYIHKLVQENEELKQQVANLESKKSQG